MPYHYIENLGLYWISHAPYALRNSLFNEITQKSPPPMNVQRLSRTVNNDWPNSLCSKIDKWCLGGGVTDSKSIKRILLYTLFVVYRKSFTAQIFLNPSAFIKRMSQEILVYQHHELQVLFFFNMLIFGSVVWRTW
jgi:hypothetical protein